MKNSYTSAASIALLLVVCSSQTSAELFSSLDGKAYYDDVLDITWLADASYAKTSGYHPTGWMDWRDANSWATSLSIDGITGWRLPTMVDIDKSGCNYSTAGGTDCGYNVLTGSAATTVYSELASMWYDTLGNHSTYDTSGNIAQGDGVGLSNTGPFVNLKAGGHWTNQTYKGLSQEISAWFFATNTGNQSRINVDTGLHAWAVHPGDLRLTVNATLNGMETSSAPGPVISGSGGSGSWQYSVKNTSDASITDVRLYARKVEPERDDSAVLLCYLDMIPAGGEATCTSENLIVAGQVKILLSAQGTHPNGNKINADTAAWYTNVDGLGTEPSLSLNVSLEDSDLDSEPPGPLMDETAYHNINVVNTSVVTLRDVRVFYRIAEPTTGPWNLTCSFYLIEPGESVSCRSQIFGHFGGEINKLHFTAQTYYRKEKFTDDDFSFYRLFPKEY